MGIIRNKASIKPFTKEERKKLGKSFGVRKVRINKREPVKSWVEKIKEQLKPMKLKPDKDFWLKKIANDVMGKGKCEIKIVPYKIRVGGELISIQ